MRIKVKIDKMKIKEVVSRASDYIEVDLVQGKLLIMAEEESNYIQSFLEVIEIDEGFEHIRVPVNIIKDLKKEEVFDIVIVNGTLEFYFYGEESKFLYEVTIQKQHGVIDYDRFMDLKKRINEYGSADLIEDLSLISALASLKTEIYCVDGVMYGEFMKGYLFKESKSPNFGISAVNLKKLMSVSSKIVFLGSYLFARLDDLEIFMFRHRVPKTCDLLQCRSQKSTHTFKLNTQNIRHVVSRFSIDNNSSVVLNVAKSKLNIKEESRSIEIDTDISELEYFRNAESEDDLLNSLENNSTVLDSNELSNPSNVKPIAIPKWVLLNAFSKREVSIKVSRSFTMINLGSYKIIYPGGSI